MHEIFNTWERIQKEYIPKLPENMTTSKRLQVSERKYNDRLRDYVQQTTARVIKYALEKEVDIIVMGKNRYCYSHMSKRTKFYNEVSSEFRKVLRRKSYKNNIIFVEQEESYTSVASYLDKDFMPVYNPQRKYHCKFSGKRVQRGKYVTSTGLEVNADVNASCNIMRKAFPEMDFSGLDICCKLNPKLLDMPN